MRIARMMAVIGPFLIPGLAQAALKPNDPAPLFGAQATLGGKEFPFALADALKKGPVVLYFYPAAFTAGCSEEAHEFAEAMPRFQALGATVIGISGDGIQKLDKFSVSDCGSRFPVAADPDGTVMKQYDAQMVPIIARSSRISYVITPDDRIFYSYSAMAPDQHVTNTLGALTAWRAQHPTEEKP